MLKNEDSKEMDISKKVCFLNGQQAHEVKYFQGDVFPCVLLRGELVEDPGAAVVVR